MANVNKVILIGNVTRDPEVKFTPKGSAVTDIGLAINRNYTLDNGDKREEVTFLEVTFWGRQAETIGEYVKKGRSIYVEGRLQLDTWDDKQSGQKRSKLRVVGENFQFLGAKPGGSSSGGGDHEGGGHSEQRPQQRASRPAPPPQASAEPDDDIPF
ncbi:MAG: single-stranded DNA-binding protein [Verrucomicrobiaceae bacterium]|nr:MAG: single-stranded DNA-binding protein [Verrucomicrobiaceae bacterium]